VGGSSSTEDSSGRSETMRLLGTVTTFAKHKVTVLAACSLSDLPDIREHNKHRHTTLASTVALHGPS
jgi:hypothetical protein